MLNLLWVCCTGVELVVGLACTGVELVVGVACTGVELVGMLYRC